MCYVKYPRGFKILRTVPYNWHVSKERETENYEVIVIFWGGISCMELCLLGFMTVKSSKLLLEYKPKLEGGVICCFCMVVALVWVRLIFLTTYIHLLFPLKPAIDHCQFPSSLHSRGWSRYLRVFSPSFYVIATTFFVLSPSTITSRPQTLAVLLVSRYSSGSLPSYSLSARRMVKVWRCLQNTHRNSNCPASDKCHITRHINRQGNLHNKHVKRHFMLT